MPAVAAGQVTTLASGGAGQKWEKLLLGGVTSADTIDVSTLGSLAFRKVQACAFVGSVQGTYVVGSIAGTVITMTSGGMSNDAVYLDILGET